MDLMQVFLAYRFQVYLLLMSVGEAVNVCTLKRT